MKIYLSVMFVFCVGLVASCFGINEYSDFIKDSKIVNVLFDRHNDVRVAEFYAKLMDYEPFDFLKAMSLFVIHDGVNIKIDRSALSAFSQKGPSKDYWNWLVDNFLNSDGTLKKPEQTVESFRKEAYGHIERSKPCLQNLPVCENTMYVFGCGVGVCFFAGIALTYIGHVLYKKYNSPKNEDVAIKENDNTEDVK